MQAATTAPRQGLAVPLPSLRSTHVASLHLALPYLAPPCHQNLTAGGAERKAKNIFGRHLHELRRKDGSSSPTPAKSRWAALVPWRRSVKVAPLTIASITAAAALRQKEEAARAAAPEHTAVEVLKLSTQASS